MLLEKLIERQEQLNMTDAEFAVELGVSRQLWQLTRTKRTPVGQKVTAGAYKRFPELGPEVLLFLGR